VGAAAKADHSKGHRDHSLQSEGHNGGHSDHAVQSTDRNSLLSQARVEATNHVSGLKLVKKSNVQAEPSNQKKAVRAQKEDWVAGHSKQLKIQTGGKA
jgi:hypothetical protein